MRILLVLALFGIARLSSAQTCPCPPDLLGYECAVKADGFVLGDGTTLMPDQQPASFTVSGKVGTVTVGNVTIAFVIGSSNASTRFVTSDGGECVGTSGNTYPAGFPKLVSEAGRALQVSGRNPLYCHTPTRDLLCFSVKGQVTDPFPALPCAPDRVEFACGIVL